MGIADFLPLFAVTVNGVPLGLGTVSSLSSIRVTDASGLESDTCELVFTNGGLGALFGMPSPGAEIFVAMGAGLAFRNMGIYVADEVEESGPPRVISVVGRAKAQGETQSGWAPISQQKTRSWEAGKTLGEIVETIAGENGLRPGATSSAAAIVPGHLDQIDESDLALLSRVAARFDLITKPAGGVLFVGKKGEGITASGGATPTVPLLATQITRWAMRRSLGETVGSVVATWRDLEAAEDIEVTAGEGEPVRRLRERFRDEGQATEAAEAELERSKRRKETLEVTLPGNPSIVADGKVAMIGPSGAASGLWVVKTATHSITDAGFTTSFSAERPA